MSEKKEKLIAAAIKLFAEKGFDNTSTQNISKEAGVATGTLFKYFKNKEQLIIDAYIQCKLAMVGALKQELNPHADFDEMMWHIWNQSVDWSLAHPDKQNFMMQVKFSRLADCLTLEKVQGEFLFFQMALKNAHRDGKIADIPLDLVEQTLSSFFNLAIDYISQRPEGREEMKKTIFKMAMQSLTPQ